MKAIITALAIVGALPVAAQSTVAGTITAEDGNAPVIGALVSALRARHTTATDQLGRFQIRITRFPDTLVISAIGYVPDTTVVTAPSHRALSIQLRFSPIQLSAIAVTADRPTTAGLGTWQLSMDAARALPAAVEPDVFRALAIVPAVSFTTPLSARPMVRGFDAGAASIRIDGHEVFNLYHVGRAFSAFPADAASQVRLSAAPASVRDGGALSGSINLEGRTGRAEGTDAGADVSLASMTGWVGGGSRTARWFVAGRVIHLGLLAALAAGEPSPYDVQDAYASLLLGAPEQPAARITLFASRDDLTTPADSMRWSTVLAGSRWAFLRRPTITLTHSASVTRFTQDAPNVRPRNSTIAVHNALERATTGLAADLHLSGVTVALGADVGLRWLDNTIVPLRGNHDVAPRAVASRHTEFGVFAEVGLGIGPARAQIGTRFDLVGSARALQPRARFVLPVGPGVAFSAGVGRTAQMLHLVGDPRPEPELTFYDFWLAAGDPDVPTAVADHATFDVDMVRGTITVRLSGFVAQARGLVEVRPATDPTPADLSQFRVGEGRTRGLEVQVAASGTATRASSLSLTYVLSWSERNWGTGSVPWSEARRHMVRVFGQGQLRPTWNVFAALEAASGVPLTPVDQIMVTSRPGLASRGSLLSYVYGPENSIRSGGTARIDLGTRFRFAGPWGSDATLGISVLNIALGPVAPLQPDDPKGSFNAAGDTIEVRWERLFVLPPIPTLTFRMEF